jgi:tungstate transport system substrate-binding protein
MSKRFISILAYIFVPFCLSAEEMRVAVTTSFANSGLDKVLLPIIQADMDLTVQLLIVGTGQALKLGEQGDVDAVLVHSRAAEEAFLAAGHGTHRREIMYNDFVIVGPSSDPANIHLAAQTSHALTNIANIEADFVSRGDDSGTHKMELALWKNASIVPYGAWYNAVGQGMGASLNAAAGMNAYILSDRASWLNFGNKQDLAITFEGDSLLINQYAFIPVNPTHHPHVNNNAAMALESWLTVPKAKNLIDGYKIDGHRLFVFNAQSE